MDAINPHLQMNEGGLNVGQMIPFVVKLDSSAPTNYINSCAFHLVVETEVRRTFPTHLWAM